MLIVVILVLVFLDVFQENSQEQIEEHEVANYHGADEEDDGDNAVLQVDDVHDFVPIFTWQKDEQAQDWLAHRIKVVARWLLAFNRGSCEETLSNQGEYKKEQANQ